MAMSDDEMAAVISIERMKTSHSSESCTDEAVWNGQNQTIYN